MRDVLADVERACLGDSTLVPLQVCVWECVCVCVWERERERERKSGWFVSCPPPGVCERECVCVREREREAEREYGWFFPCSPAGVCVWESVWERERERARARERVWAENFVFFILLLSPYISRREICYLTYTKWSVTLFMWEICLGGRHVIHTTWYDMIYTWPRVSADVGNISRPELCHLTHTTWRVSRVSVDGNISKHNSNIIREIYLGRNCVISHTPHDGCHVSLLMCATYLYSYGKYI